MGVGFLIGIFIALIVLFIIVPLVFYLINKKGYTIMAYTISAILALLIIVPASSLIFEEELYSKSNVAKDLEKIEIRLQDEFKFIDIEITGLSDYYQFVKLQISERDKERIIKLIQNAQNFKKTNEKFNYSIYESVKPGSIENHQNGYFYIRQSIDKKEGYSDYKTAITLLDSTNIMELSVIQD